MNSPGAAEPRTKGRAARARDEAVLASKLSIGRSEATRVLFALLLLFAVGLALTVAQAGVEYIPLISVAAGLLFATTALVHRRASWPVEQYRPAVACFGSAVAAVAVFGCAWHWTAAVVRDARPVSVLFGANGFVLYVFLPVIFAAFCSGIAAMALFLINGAALRWIMRRIAAIAPAALAALVLLASVRASRRPGIDAFVRELQQSSVLLPAPGSKTDHEIRGMSGAGLPGRPVERVYSPGLLGRRRGNFGDLTVVQSCEVEGCRIGVVDGPNAPRALNEVPADATIQRWNEDGRFLRYRADGVVYIEWTVARTLEWSDPASARMGGWPDWEPSSLARLRAIDASAVMILTEYRRIGGRWVPMSYSPTDLARRVAMPMGWILAGIGGLLAAGGFRIVRRRMAQRSRSLDDLRPGTLAADGWISFESGPAVHLDGTQTIPEGPVLVAADLSSGSAYRGHGLFSTRDVLPGTLAEHREKAAFGLLRLDSAIVAVAILAAAPLAAAAMVGLVV